MSSSSSVPTSQSITETFHNLAAIAVDLSNPHVSIHDGRHPDDPMAVLSIERSVRNWEGSADGTRQKYLYQIPFFPKEINGVSTIPSLPPTLLDASIHAQFRSPSGKYQIVVKKSSQTKNNKSGKQATVVEIWQEGALAQRLEEPSENPHGSILFNDVTFGSPSWSKDEKYLLHTAERLPPKTTSYWEKCHDEHPGTGEQHVLGKGTVEDWGERYEDQSPLTDVYMMCINSGKITRIPIWDDKYYDTSSTLGSIALGQPTFHPNSQGEKGTIEIALTCFDAGGLSGMSRRLGMVFCRNRPSQILSVQIGMDHPSFLKEFSSLGGKRLVECPHSIVSTKSVSQTFMLARSPQYVVLNDDTETTALLFLGNKDGFHSHDGCMGLYSYDTGNAGNKKIQEIISVVENPFTSGPMVPNVSEGIGFPGIFTGGLPELCQIPNATRNEILVNTLWGSFGRVIRVNVCTGTWSLLQFKDGTIDELSSQTFVCFVDRFHMIVSETKCNQPTRLWKCRIPAQDGDPTSQDQASNIDASMLIDFSSIACTSNMLPKRNQQNILGFDTRLITIPKEGDNHAIQSLLLLPKTMEGTTDKLPLVIVPHGGPHSVSTSSFVPGFSMLAQQYAVLLPNYRGSIGFGQKGVTSLLTNVGDNDVEDVIACMKKALLDYQDRLDSKRVGICGGSHGGFLTAHCTSQYPELFRAAVMRNPVTNIASMVTATDISDWCYAECLGSTNPSKFQGPTKEEINIMYDKSPMSRINQVKTPTLIALGLKDLRVPPSQGKEWYYSLRSQGVDTELLFYPNDNHGLSNPATEADHWIRIIQWFQKYL